MTSRRQERVARVVKEAVSDAIANHLSDPRIEGFVSVTRVEMTADLREANVYLSIFGGADAVQSKTFAAISHARSKIQSIVADELQSKFCPVLHLYMDDKFKKAMETVRLIDQLASESKKKNQANKNKE